jgi:flagellar motor switch protein FliN/FliY
MEMEPQDDPGVATAVAEPDPDPMPEPVTSVNLARFPPILEEGPGEVEDGRNLDLLMDVTVPITAEIGRTELPLAEVLRLGPGSVVELDKSADEPVEILVNGKLLATGEVVVVGDRFGVRILDVVERPEG